VMALVSLGIPRAKARESVLAARRDGGEELSVEELVKRTLRK